MASNKLDNLVKTGGLKKEPPDQQEFKGLLGSAKKRFKDAQIKSLSIESRFDLGYNAVHALALAALRWHGYRSENRFLVFQCLPHTLGLGPEVWRVLAKCHDQRNRAEYQGHLDIDEQLIVDLIEATKKVLEKVEALGPVK